MKFLNHEPLCDVKLFLIKSMKLLNHKILCDVNLKKKIKTMKILNCEPFCVVVEWGWDWE